MQPANNARKGLFKFTIDDAQGRSHLYEVTQHRVREGLRISLLISTFGLEALAGALGGSSVRGVLDADLSGLKLDALRDAVLTGAVEALIFDVLRYANRDGASLDADDAQGSINLDDAYRGNFAELYQAAWKVIQGNGWMPLPPGLIAKATAALGSEDDSAQE